MEEFELIAKTFQGLEEVLAKELTQLGANNIQIGRRMVSFTGDLKMMYKANFCLRTAIRILKPIKHFKAKNADEVYDAVKEIQWEDYMNNKSTFAVDSVVYSEEFRHSKFVAYKVKDAIADYFRDKTGERPSVRINNPDLALNIHIAEETCTLSLDSSGESLHRRGYRQGTVEAPLNEVLAAGMIMLTGWDGECDLIDPMCGSGTIPIEAALIARNIYPGVFRKEYAFENWKDFDKNLFDEIYNDDTQEREFTHHIYGYDNSPKAISIASDNVKSASVGNEVTIKQQPFQQFEQPEEKSIIIMNPPYGERISTPDLLGLYKVIGERLKHAFLGNDAWVISCRLECFDEIGLKPSAKIPLFNGALECEFRKYQIFDGKYKDYVEQTGEGVKSDEETGVARKGGLKRERKHREDGERVFSSLMENGERRDKSSYRERRESSEDERRPRRSYGERREFGGERKEYDGERRERKPFGGRREFGGERKSFGGERKSFGGERRERRPYGERKDFDGEKRERREFGGDRKPFGGERRERKPFGEKREFGGERKERRFGDRSERFGERREGGFRKSGDRDRKFGGDREKRFSRERKFDDKKDFRRKREDRKGHEED